MPLTQLAKAQWQPYFDRLAKVLGTKQVQIEVVGLGLGDQIEADWIPLIGVSYDPKNDILAVIAEGVDHLIRRPKQIHIDHEIDWLHSIEAIDAEDVRHIILLKDPLSLSAP